MVSTPLKNIYQLGLLFPIYGKIKFMFQTTNQQLIQLITSPLSSGLRISGEELVSYVFEVRCQRGWDDSGLMPFSAENVWGCSGSIHLFPEVEANSTNLGHEIDCM